MHFLSLTVVKFGGSSLADRERIFRAAARLRLLWREGREVVAVVSARGDATDELISTASLINADPDRRELDMLVSTGEQVSAALVAMALAELKVPSVSLTGAQGGVLTDNAHGFARILSIDARRIRAELAKGKVVVVTGFQGARDNGDVTTLGRGGSDTSAVALGVALGARECVIYTDVEGIFTADPRKLPSAKKHADVGANEMLELSSAGAGVLAARAVELARKYNFKFEVRSSLSERAGTVIGEDTTESLHLSGLAREDNVAEIFAETTVQGVRGFADIFARLAQHGIAVDMISRGVRERGEEASFAVAGKELAEVERALGDFCSVIGSSGAVKLSLVGNGLRSRPSVAARMFGTLANVKIPIRRVSSSELRLSVLVDARDADAAAQAIHEEFF